MQTKILKPDDNNIEICAEALRCGQLVAFPTETVYGLGANALNPDSVKKIYEAKGRPSDNPLIVHLGGKENISDYAEVTEKAKLLIDAFMPGPVTILLRKKACIPDIVTGGRNTVGIRIPNNTVAQKFLMRCNVPVCAPSANTSSRPSPTTAQHVWDDLFGRIEYILDGGSCDIGIESTIIDISNDAPVLLRKGKISPEDIENVLNEKVVTADNSHEALCPGLKYKHYSPKAKVILVRKSLGTVRAVSEVYDKQTDIGCKTVILCYNENADKYGRRTVVSAGNNATEYAQNFYGRLRSLDKEGVDVSICEGPEEYGIGLALYNRMYKAAGGEVS